MSRHTSPPWPEQPARRPDRQSGWLTLAYVLGALLVLFGLAYLALALLAVATANINPMGSNK